MVNGTWRLAPFRGRGGGTVVLTAARGFHSSHGMATGLNAVGPSWAAEFRPSFAVWTANRVFRAAPMKERCWVTLSKSKMMYYK